MLIGTIRPATFPNLIVNGTATADWKYVRMTANHDTGAPVSRVSFTIYVHANFLLVR